MPATGPDVFGGTNVNDVNAAVINLFGTVNRLHDWTYDLGFSESRFNFQSSNFEEPGSGGDLVLADAQGAALTSEGAAAYLSQPNDTPPDGTPLTIEARLWQPVAATFYGPCVDGDFDASVIAHAYARALVDRMVAGASDNAVESSSVDGQAGALREGWADVIAAEFLHETGGATSFTVGAYVSGNSSRGLRNYAMDASPLNYSNVRGWDGSGAGAASDDGEIWAAVLHEVRKAYVSKYGSPGGRRFIALVIGALPSMPSDATMRRARDELLEGARESDRTMIWRAFARRGLGAKATGSVDVSQPGPSFESPRESNETTVKFRLRSDGGKGIRGKVLVGAYEANVTPVADTDSATGLASTAKFVPGTYSFVFRAPGYGAVKRSIGLPAGQRRTVTVTMPTNLASSAKGATVSGPGSGLDGLIDDTESTNWTAVADDPVEDGTVAVTINLAGSSSRTVNRVQVSALLDAGAGQNRFTALRAFRVEACDATIGSCAAASDFAPIGEFEPFAAPAPRPMSPDLNLRSLALSPTTATHVRIVVLENQCTGGPAFRGSLESDPAHEADCVLGAAEVARTVRASEFQLFSGAATLKNVRNR